MADFHVDHINGSDSTGDGSAGNPWGTITHALTESAAGTGDTIKVAGSGMTTVDSTAVLSAVDTLTTTTDLTSSISVGDVVCIYPNGVTEFENWVYAEAINVTATTIQFYEDIYMPGDWKAGTSTYTIKTVDAIYESTASTLENIQQLGAGADVIGGYNSGFTSVIGYTYLRRSTGAGSGTGTCFNLTFGINVADQPFFKNFWLGNWSYGINTNYGSSSLSTNIQLYNVTSRLVSYLAHTYNKDGGPADIYLVGCAGQIGINAYQSNFHAAGLKPEYNIRNFTSTRYVTLSSGIIKKFHGWQPGQNSATGPFGQCFHMRTFTCRWDDTDYVTNIIEANRGGFGGTNQALLLVQNGFGRLDSLNLITGNTTLDYYWAPFPLASYDSNKISLEMPTGFDITTHKLVGERDNSVLSGNDGVRTLGDTNGVWVQGAGTLEKVSTTVYETGNSSREIYAGARSAYGCGDPTIFLAQIKKTTTSAPTSISIRYKATGGNGGWGTRAYFADNFHSIDLTTGNVQVTADDTWRTATFTCNSGTNFDVEWNSIPVGSYWGINWTWLSYNEFFQHAWIDSVTVNY